MRQCIVLFGLSVACLSARAEPPSDPPAFDRPGLGFSTDTVGRGAAALEFGLPSYLRETDAEGVRSTTLSGDALLRTGLAPGLELQVSGTPWNRQRLRAPDGGDTRLRGAGDSSVGVKWAGPGSNDRTAWAVLATAVVARGDAAFSDGRQYALAASVEQALTDRWSLALFAEHQRGAGQRTTTWAPSLSLQATPTVSTYLEAGFFDVNDAPDQTLAGAGLSWQVRPGVQLDISFDVGLDDDSPDLQMASGLSVYLD